MVVVESENRINTAFPNYFLSSPVSFSCREITALLLRVKFLKGVCWISYMSAGR